METATMADMGSTAEMAGATEPAGTTGAGSAGATQAEPALSLKGLAFSYDGKKTVFSDIDLEVRPGEAFVVLGANGAGKSTLLNCMGGMLTPTRGTVRVFGRPIETYSTNDLARLMGYVPQISNPTFEYTVRDYVVMGRAPHLGLLDVPGKTEYDKADEVLERMGITHLADKFCSNISGGERQQAQIARVLVQEAKIVLLDEPTNHLDYGNQLRIVKIVDSLVKQGLAVVMTSHNPDHAILLNGTVGLLRRDGTMVHGPAEQIVTEESLRSLYDIDLNLVYIDKLHRTACVAGSL